VISFDRARRSVVERQAEVATKLNPPRPKPTRLAQQLLRSTTITLDSSYSTLACISADGGPVPLTAEASIIVWQD
jgi:hypothetical protein